MKSKFLNFLVLLFISGFVINAVVCEETEEEDLSTEEPEDCCSEGEEWVDQGCSAPEDPDRSEACLSSAVDCCRKVIKDRVDCAKGIEVAKEGNQCDAEEGEVKNCCHSCRLAITIGASSSSCGVPSNRTDYICCEFERERQKEETTTEEVEETTTPSSSPKKANTPSTINACEDIGFELCAHLCIVNGDSYTCQCRTGFKLRADKHSCQKITENNRCQKKNPCEQKCQDTGEALICSCRRGYELLKDNVSCIDIDECDLEIHKCRANTKCVNTLGSYKCVPETPPKAAQPSRGEEEGAPGAGRGNCPNGFKFDKKNHVCDDIDECEQSACPSGLVCVNSIGSFNCAHGGAESGAIPDAGPPRRGSPRREPSEEEPPHEESCPPGFKYDMDLADCFDIDECVQKTDDCNRLSQYCLNTHGAFTCQDKASKTSCPPGFKMQPEGCKDIDECSESSTLCSPGSFCVNEPGGYDCKSKPARAPPAAARNKEETPAPPPPPIRPPPARNTTGYSPRTTCPKGYRRISGGCADINECQENSHTCDNYQICHNTLGGHRCVCKPGFKKDMVTLACTDINECQRSELNNCEETQRCDNTIGSYHCARQISCGTGYTLNAGTNTCEDDDECALGLHNCFNPGYECRNQPGTFRCVLTTTSSTPIPQEYDSGEYYDPDEEEPSVQPSVDSRYPENDRNEPPRREPSQEPSRVPEDPYRRPEEPPRRPEEQPGRPEDPRNREEESRPTEATPDNRKDPEPDPRTSDPYYGSRPSSPPNRGQDPYYRPENPPRGREDPPEEPRAIPSIYNPSRRPNENDERRRPVYTNVPAPPKNVDQMEVGDNVDKDGNIYLDTKKLPENKWLNLVPSAKICLPGYEKNSRGECEDLDECRIRRHSCSQESEVCYNTPGSYKCVCANGYIKDSRSGLCKRKPEVSAAPRVYSPIVPQWSPNPAQVCDIGFQVNPATRRCEDVDECADGRPRCGATEDCVNTPGGYRCVCGAGYTQIGDRCVSLHPLPQPVYPQRYPPRTPPPRVVAITSPSRQSFCPIGYRRTNDNECIDIDECALNTHTCAPLQQCVNAPGGYMCKCPHGHRMSSNGDCEDVNECTESRGTVCSNYATCINTVGSFRCECRAGFTTAAQSHQLCEDVDECAANGGKGPCHHSCVNVWGSYRCACNRGFRLSHDNRTCVDIDECEDKNRRLCVGECRNNPGSYQCACPSGYKLGNDKRSCIDIDECEEGTQVCGSEEVCQNTRGAARCSSIACPPGYHREAGSKHRCRRAQGYCRLDDLACIRQPDTYSFNFITFVSKLYIPPRPVAQVDLFTMKGPSWHGAMLSFQLKLVEARAGPGIERATMDCFKMTPSPQQALVSLVKPLIGPQEIHLELSMELYTSGRFDGTAVAKIFIYVSEYEF